MVPKPSSVCAIKSYCTALELAAKREPTENRRSSSKNDRTLRSRPIPRMQAPDRRHNGQLGGSLVNPVELKVKSAAMTKESKLHAKNVNASKGFGGAVEKQIRKPVYQPVIGGSIRVQATSLLPVLGAVLLA